MKEGKSLVGVYSNNSVNNSNSRQKRLRTSFKHHQLRTMKNYFAVNHNPDAKDLKELAQKTGLTKRVLQVVCRLVDVLHVIVVKINKLQKKYIKINNNAGLSCC